MCACVRTSLSVNGMHTALSKCQEIQETTLAGVRSNFADPRVADPVRLSLISPRSGSCEGCGQQIAFAGTTLSWRYAIAGPVRAVSDESVRSPSVRSRDHLSLSGNRPECKEANCPIKGFLGGLVDCLESGAPQQSDQTPIPITLFSPCLRTFSRRRRD